MKLKNMYFQTSGALWPVYRPQTPGTPFEVDFLSSLIKPPSPQFGPQLF